LDEVGLVNSRAGAKLGEFYPEQAMVFNGTSTTAESGVHNGLVRTIAAWIKPGSSDNVGYYEPIVDSNDERSGSYDGSGLGLDDGRFKVRLDDTGFWDTGVSVQIGQWQYVCLTFNGSTARLYVNGVQRAQTSYSASESDVAGKNYRIGWGQSGEDTSTRTYFHGEIRDLEIYDRFAAGTDVNFDPAANAGGPYSVATHATIALDGSASSDVDGSIVLYEWDLDDDGYYDDATGATAGFTSSRAGWFTVGLRVTDDDGAQDTDTATVIVRAASVQTINFNDYTVGSYGDDQEPSGGYAIEDGGATLRLTGNSWKQIEFPYTITANTVLEFDYQSDHQGEIQGIAFDTDTEYSEDRTFRVYGTQDWGIADYDNYASSAPAVKHYTILLGRHYTGQMNYLAFINDDDSAPTGESVFSNIRVYEQVPVTTAVVDRHVFYNNSAWDGNDAAANADDDDAIATDKQALLPGQTATFANYTSFTRGINGIMLDIDGLADPDALGESDFQFKAGNSNDPGAWTPAPPPVSITVRQGAGSGDSDRVTIIWADNAIAKQWLQVTVLATDNTGLPESDVFYFGSAVGDTGNSATQAYVNAFDTGGVRDHPRGFLNPATIDDVYDFNRDRRVNAFDFGAARDNATGFLNALELITVPAATGGMMMVGGSDGGNEQSSVSSPPGMPQQETSDPIEVLAAAAGTTTVHEDRFDLLGGAVQPLTTAKADDTTATADEEANGAADAGQLLAGLPVIQPSSPGDSDAENAFETPIALESVGAAAVDDAATDGDTALADPLVDALADSQLALPLTG